MAFEQTKPKVYGFTGDRAISFIQASFASVASGELDTGLKSVETISKCQVGSSTLGSDLIVDEDLFGTADGDMTRIDGSAVTIRAGTDTFWTLMCEGYQ